MTLSDVAHLALLSWDTVKTIAKTHLAKEYGKPALGHVRYLSIDEIHLGAKMRFFTIVIDLEDGRILWAAPGRGKDALRGFWRRLRVAKARIQGGGHRHERRLLERGAGAFARRRSGL